MTDNTKAVVLLSGGMDSCVTAAMARQRHGPANLALLHVMYGQRTENREKQAFDQIAGHYNVSQRLISSSTISAPSEGQRSQTSASPSPRIPWRSQGPVTTPFR